MSLRFTGQVKFNASLLKARLRNSKSPRDWSTLWAG
jgi:hypothetical protein